MFFVLPRIIVFWSFTSCV